VAFFVNIYFISTLYPAGERTELVLVFFLFSFSSAIKIYKWRRNCRYAW